MPTPQRKHLPIKLIATLWLGLGFASLPSYAELSLPSVFADHMVLQRDQANPIWGNAQPAETIHISIGGESVTTTADKSGAWRAALPSLPAGGPYTLEVQAEERSLAFEDVLVGEVWFCSGQSNMEWPLVNTYGAEVEIAAANQPQIRLLTVGRNGTDTPQADFDGEWQLCAPDTVSEFSAIGYYYAKTLNDALGVPIGLIDNSWGGSSAEAWVPRQALEEAGAYAPMLEHWDERVANFDPAEFDDYVNRFKAWVAAGRQDPPMDWAKSVSPIDGQHRPSNIYNGMVHPLAGYGIRGVIWYQGEANGDRGEQYQHLFPLLVETWREKWGQGDFPFYWVQLADWLEESAEPTEGGWPELREAQTLSQDKLPNSGQAVIIDIGEGRDIHPRDKRTVASRLVRWPLSQIHGYDIAYQSPQYKSHEVVGNKIRITLDPVSRKGLWAFDTPEVKGFAIAGADKKWVWAEAKIIDRYTVEVWSDEVAEPVAARYGWANNPEVNLYDRNGLPVTPFRTDDWPLVSEGKQF